MMETELLLEMTKIGPLVTLLIIAIFYFLRREKKLEEKLEVEQEHCDIKIEKLHNELRNSEKENLAIISSLSDLVDKLNTDTNNSNLMLTNEIKNLKEFLKDRLDYLKIRLDK